MKTILRVLVLAAAVLAPLQASDEVKTLPQAVYSQMKSGKKLDKVWVGPGYDKAKGFQFGELNYRAETRNGSVIEYFPTAFKGVAKDQAPYKLVLAVTGFSEKTYAVITYKDGWVEVEGQLQDSEGKAVAAFKTKQTYPASSNDPKKAVDGIVSAIIKDLM